ncbi:histidine phosphatase superfamily [Russula dissimulans]|nr:histidine phosphatase superfamily [Russula dissimulans]
MLPLVLQVLPFLFTARPALSASASNVMGSWDSVYCNAPHVNASHYQPPEKGAELVHLSVMMRHHKRTPIALVPNELGINVGIEWDCSHVAQFTYDGSGARLSHSVTVPPGHPFAQQFWAGSCEEGQLTAGGFHDSKVHGKDLWEVYHHRLGFLRTVDPSEIGVRTTYIDRTKHVASGVLAGMDPSTTTRPWPVHAQPQRIDSLASTYKCPRADALVAAAQAAPFWQDILQKNLALKGRIDSVLGTTNSKAVWPSTFTFYQDVLTSRVCNDHPLPCNAAGECVSEEDAAKIFELGNLESDYLWHGAQNASEYNQLTFGVMLSELADALEAPKQRLALYVAHDTSIVRLAAGLGIFPLRWPRLGSEIVIEVWKDKKQKQFARVLYDGELIDSLSWVPLDDFTALLRQHSPDHLFEKCTSVSGKVEGVERQGLSLIVQ